MAASGVLPIRVLLLGAPQITSADGAHTFTLPRKTLDVLAYLILNRGRALSRASVAFSLFPDDDEEAARNSLRRNLSYLLSALPEPPAATPFVLADGKTISWNTEAPAAIDVDEFERAVAERRDDDALGVYRGELLPSLYADWTTAERERLRGEYHQVLLRKIQAERSLRRFDEASTAAHTLLNEDPWREDIVRLLMAVRHEAGDRSGALAEFDRFAERLRSEMRTEPMAETLEVRDAVLRGAYLPTSERARSAPGSVESKPAFGLPFVGREEPIASALDAWHQAADGRARVLVVAGEAGIGKSRFVTELARAIEREGGHVVRGQTSAGAERRPYEAFVDALQHRSRGERVESLLEEHAATLSDDRSARLRLFETIRRSVDDLARSRPLAVMLEDLHWAGPDTVALLDFVAQRLGSAPVLIVVTMRTDELARGHRLRSLVGQLETSDVAEVLTLNRLNESDAAKAVAVLVREADESRVAEAVAWADGVPLLLLEAARDVIAGRVPTSADIAGLVGDRFARLTPAAATVLVYAAAAGDRFELATIAAAMGWSNAAIVDALAEAVELGLVRAAENIRGIAFAFGHHVLHAAAYERIEAQDRTRAHGMVARALAALPDSEDVGAAETARQFQAADEPERAARYWCNAARYALAVFANEDARAAATAGLALAGEDAAVRYDLLAVREDALRRIGRSRERRADTLALLECAGENLDRRCEALARVFEAHTDDAATRDRALEQLAELAPLSERYAAVYDRTSSRRAAANDDYAQARDAALQAAQRFEKLRDEREALLARLHHIRMIQRLGDVAAAQAAVEALRPHVEQTEDIALAVEFYFIAARAAIHGPYEAALADARRSLELALRIGDRSAEARARTLVAAISGRVRDHAERELQAKAALAAYRDVGDPAGIDSGILNLAAWQSFCGDFDAVRQTLSQLRTGARPIHALLATGLLGYADMWEGRLESAVAKLRGARDVAKRLKLPRYVALAELWLAEAYRLSGNAREARRSIDAAARNLSTLEEPDTIADVRALSARLYATRDDRDAALADARATEELAARQPIPGYAFVAWHLAVAYALIGDGEAADRCAAEAARAFMQDALQMSPDAIEHWSRLPWHREIIAFLSGRSIPYG